MELRNLKTFHVAAKLLNLTKTAEHLNLTQPSVTAQIQSLEYELKHPLFYRVGRTTYLTPVGKMVEKYTNVLFSTIEEMEKEIANLALNNKKITIAASEIFCTYYLPPIISEYLKIFPDIEIRLRSCNSDDIVHGVESGEYDIGIIAGEYHKGGLVNSTILEEEFILVVSKELHEQYTTDEMFHHLPFIKYNDNHYGYHDKLMKKFINKLKLPIKKIIEMSSDEAIKKAALNHIGIALLTADFVREEVSCVN